MKKRMVRVLSMMLILCMVLPYCASAAGSYKVWVAIKEEKNGTKINELEKTYVGSRYDSDNVAVELGKFVNLHEDEMKIFGAPEMKKIMDRGIKIATEQNGAGWTEFAGQFSYANDEEKALFTKYETTFGDLGEGVFVSTFENKLDSDKSGSVYTVTITVEPYTHKPSQKPTVEVKPVTDNSGTTTISNPAAQAGEKVSVTTKPAENKVTGYVVVRDQDGNKVPLKYDGNGKYSFEMPEGGVTVETTYRPAPTDPKASGVATLLNSDDHTAFMQGYPEGDFRPNGSITRAEVATIFYRLLRNQNVEATKSFDDINGHWASTAVETLASLGIIKGVTENSFAPQTAITRAQFAAICARFATAVTDSKTTFADVSDSHWASDEIKTAATYGWIYGKGNNLFDPDGFITRAEAAAIVNRMFARLGDQIAIDEGSRKEFTDVSDAHWGWYEISEATYGHGHSDEEKFVHEFWME